MGYPIIICEDQTDQRQQIVTIIQNYLLFHHDQFRLVLQTPEPSAVQQYLRQSHVKQGIYFLDIDLRQQIDGIQLATEIRAADPQAKIIFTTAHTELLPLTLKRRVEALGFIDKAQAPESYRAEVVELLTLAQRRLDATLIDAQRAFVFSVGSQVFTLDFQDVLFVEAAAQPHRLTLRTRFGQYEFYGKLAEIGAAYPDLMKVSRSCLINPENIFAVDFKTRQISFPAAVTRPFALGKVHQLREYLRRREER
ncbi:response regulator transcription factor [Lapidilactobacillus luobeiensis]|uniref:response regulator transcription factor n=1 Tax=Lapidilactobacillus luobeiensis TaxID=2950371 RepID=UPI0021C3FFE6|nr:response regulator transcription factor [Lapidilactobacillus luobeiensis]